MKRKVLWSSILFVSVLVTLLLSSVLVAARDPDFLYERDEHGNQLSGYWELQDDGFYWWYNKEMDDFEKDKYRGDSFVPRNDLSRVPGECHNISAEAIGVLVYRDYTMGDFETPLCTEVFASISDDTDYQASAGSAKTFSTEDYGFMTPVITSSKQNCKNFQTCQEIDTVWTNVANVIGADVLVWVPDTSNLDAGEWRSLSTLYTSGGTGGTYDFNYSGAESFSLHGTDVYCIAGAAYNDPLINTFLDAIAWAEGSSGAYNTMFMGLKFTDYSAHPKDTGEIQKGIYSSGLKVTSTAAGRYQFVHSIYTRVKKSPHNQFSTGFGPKEQDEAAWYLASGRGLTIADLQAALNSHNFITVSDKVAKEWASLPYGPNGCSKDHCDSNCFQKDTGRKCGSGHSYYGQYTKSLSDLYTVFHRCYTYHST